MNAYRRPRWLSAVLSAALLASLVATGARGVGTAAGKPIVIGATVSETGAYSEPGKYALAGYQYYVEEQNKKGGWLGRPLQLKIYDDASDPATAVTDYQKLVQQDHVDVIVGPYSSAITAAVANVADQYKMPMLSPEVASTAPFKRGLKYDFMATSPAPNYVAGSIEIAKDHGYKNIAITGEDTAFPKAIAASTVEAAKKAGLNVVFNELYPHNASDYTAIAQKIKQANPDAVLSAAYFPDAVGLLRALKQAGFTPKELFFAVGATEPNFGTEVGKDADGVLSTSNWSPELKTQGNAQFVKGFTTFYKKPPDYHSAQNYAALQTFSAAIAKVGSLDNDKIRDALSSLKVPTILGVYSVEPSTGIQTGYNSLTMQWQGGKDYVVWPDQYAQKKPITPFQWASR
ncbi:MAG: amino acid ABC transporter substrate-binding protein [Vulcanimicrobiaceae bacterium]